MTVIEAGQRERTPVSISMQRCFRVLDYIFNNCGVLYKQKGTTSCFGWKEADAPVFVYAGNVGSFETKGIFKRKLPVLKVIQARLYIPVDGTEFVVDVDRNAAEQAGEIDEWTGEAIAALEDYDETSFKEHHPSCRDVIVVGDLREALSIPKLFTSSSGVGSDEVNLI